MNKSSYIVTNLVPLIFIGKVRLIFWLTRPAADLRVEIYISPTLSGWIFFMDDLVSSFQGRSVDLFVLPKKPSAGRSPSSGCAYAA